MHLSIKGDARAIDISQSRRNRAARILALAILIAGDGQREIDVALVWRPGPVRIWRNVKELEHAASDGSSRSRFFRARDDAKHAKPASKKLGLYGSEYHICMGVVHMSEAEVVKDIAAVLAKVRQGVEIVIEQDHRAIAVIKPSHPAGRMISDVIADLEARGSSATMDEDFARDIEEGINAHREAWDPPSWD